MLFPVYFAFAADPAGLVDDRLAVERVYYNHRLGTKPAFEQAMPHDLAERLVKQDLHKEAVLKKAYGVDITPAMLDAEVRRIDATTRAPDMLAELKAALGNDTNRFARTVARPIIVDRILRERFDNDDQLHAAQRHEAEETRNEMLAAKKDGAGFEKLLPLLKRDHTNGVTETTWQLNPSPGGTNAPDANLAEIQKKFGPNAQILSSPSDPGKERKFYFDDLPPELQNVLRVQLRQAGDVSAVIEMPGGFAVYLAKEKTAAALSVAALSIPKRSFEEWLAEQKGSGE